MTKIGVAIPYYQRDPGILRRALASAAAQELADDVQMVIVLVDDQSPCAPEPEIAGLAMADRHRVAVLKQSNAGPGAARNTALDHFAEHPVDFVAFLDSDDIWLPNHLSSALACLGESADYYFADHRRDYSFASGATYFSGNETIQRWLRDPANGPIAPTGTPDVFRLRTEWGLLPFMQDYLSQTSTVVYRLSQLGHVRFDPTLRTAGEDLLFWITLASEAREICLTTRVDVECGSGVNIFHSTLTWDHPNTPARFAYQLMLWKYVADRFDLSPSESDVTRYKISGFGRGFSYIWLRSLLKTGNLNLPLLRSLRDLGWKEWRILPNLVDVARRKAMHMPLFPEH